MSAPLPPTVEDVTNLPPSPTVPAPSEGFSSSSGTSLPLFGSFMQTQPLTVGSSPVYSSSTEPATMASSQMGPTTSQPFPWSSYGPIWPPPNGSAQSGPSGSKTEPYPLHGPTAYQGYSPPPPYWLYATSGRPEPGDPLYTAASDGPEIRLISLVLTGADNYTAWSREFRRALTTKDKDGFLDGAVLVPTDDRSAR